MFVCSVDVTVPHLMDNCRDSCDREGTASAPGGGGSEYRLFGRHSTIHQCMGGGIAADVLLWKRWHVSFGIIIVATAVWITFERSGLSFLSIYSDVLLILIVLLFLRANFTVFRNKQLQELPELVLSEEMVNSAAASFHVKINSLLLMAHDITLGKDFRLFFKVAICLWILSVIGSYISFFTLAYIGTIISITVPALYNRHESLVDKCFGVLHRKFSRHYRIVDESFINRLPRSLSLKEKNM